MSPIIIPHAPPAVFLWSDAMATIWGRHFLWKVRRHQWRLDKVRRRHSVTTVRCCQQSSKCGLSVRVSGMERSRTTWTALTLVLARWPSSIIYISVHVLRIVAMATIQGWHLFRSELPTNRGRNPIDKIRHSWFAKSDVQDCQQRLSSAFDLFLIFLCSLIQTPTLTPPPTCNNDTQIQMWQTLKDYLFTYMYFITEFNMLYSTELPSAKSRAQTWMYEYLIHQ